MYSREPQRKASKGSVQIKASNGRLQLVFSYGSKRHYLSLGLSNSKINRRAAEAKAMLIESDIRLDRFDPTLTKYKPQSALSTVTPNTTPIATPKPDLAELWEKYTAFKKPQVSQSTYATDYRKYRNHIANLPSRKLEDAIIIRDSLVANLSPNAARKTLTNINACCNWALKSGLIDANPFPGMASEVKLPKHDDDIRSFTCQERDAIIRAFEEGKLYSYYAPLVKFLFYTGARPSEALALQWKHIGSDWRFITFEQSLTFSQKGLALKRGLKTQASRKFPINNQLRGILEPLKTSDSKPDDLIFKGKKGAYIDFGDFHNHAWKGYKNRHGNQIDGIVTQLVQQGTVSEYLKSYAIRHTFITLALEHGLDAKDVARLVGNSAEVIYRHYAGNRRELFVPEL